MNAGESRPLRGICRVPGDKSISHRGLLLAALAPGESVIRGLASAGDCAATLGALRRLGVPVELRGAEARVHGPLVCPAGETVTEVDCGRSGTTMRLLAGLAAGQRLRCRLVGHPQLLARPMERVAVPLRLMGAQLETGEGGRPPLAIRGGALQGIAYRLPVASAQVKSAVLLAGLGAEGETRVGEVNPTRDHTERLLTAMGASLRSASRDGVSWTALRASALRPLELDVPGDASSAAVMATAAALVPGSRLMVEGVCANPTRTAFFDLLAAMGAEVELAPHEPFGAPEPQADLVVSSQPLHAVTIPTSLVPLIVDELPLVALLATQAEGTTVVRGAGELRVKETDRIAVLVRGLRALGADIEEMADGFVVHGPTRLHGGSVESAGDHRLAMTLSLADLVAEGRVRVGGLEFVGDSFPEFERVLEEVS